MDGLKLKKQYESTSIHEEQQNHDTNCCRRSGDDRDRDRDSHPAPAQEEDKDKDEDFDGVLKHIGEMMMEEEDLEHKTCMFYDSMALQATENYFYDALSQPTTEHPNPNTLDHDLSGNASVCGTSLHISTWICNPQELEYSSAHLTHHHQPFNTSNGYEGGVNGKPNSLALSTPHQLQDLLFGTKNQFDFRPRDGEGQLEEHLFPNGSIVVYHPETYETTSEFGAGAEAEERVNNHSRNRSIGKKNRKDTDSAQGTRSNKLLANSANDSDPLDVNDNVFLGSDSNLGKEEEFILCSSPKAQSNETMKQLQQRKQSKSYRKSRRRAGKIERIIGEVVDLRSLLMQCAQAAASHDSRTGNELLKRIKKHSSPLGDATERLAYYFSNALEARLEGNGPAIYTSFISKKYSAAEALMGYWAYITACPFKKMLSIYANKCIEKVANGATRLHIVDFGILCGFQWPSLIRSLSERPGGPPQLRITGIEHPQPGFRPAERVEETGRRLARFCNKFNVPFVYKSICKKWETIDLKDLLVDGDERYEVVVVNCLYRLDNLADETVVSGNPRDVVLKLIKRIKPHIFTHGVTNGTYNSLFCLTRFREAFFHFSSLFDMFDVSLPRENQGRLLFERDAFGRDAINIIACEGTERVERPETYKQWQLRVHKAGFAQLPIDRECLNYVKDKVSKCYHKDFIVEEDNNWMLQGWKGRVLQSFTCWQLKNK